MSALSELKNIGLGDKEAKVYLATLELGQASVQNIAKKAGVNRATTYVILEALLKKGLVSTFEQEKKNFYIANSPESLLSLLEIEKKEIEERQKNFQSILPELRSLVNADSDKPVIRFFEGKQGLLNGESEFLAEYKDRTEPARMIYSKDLIDQIFKSDDLEGFRTIRKKNQIKSKVLYNWENGELSTTPDGQRIKIDKARFPITSDIAIYGDSVRIASLGKRLSTVIIKDQEIANTLKSVFDLAWEAAQAKK